MGALLAAAMLAGVQLPPAMSVGGETLELASCGVRDTLWIDHYVAALYLPPGAPPAAVAGARRPKAVLMQVVESRFLPPHIPEKWRRALASELEQEPMQRVRAAYEQLADGDVVIFSYAPEAGVTMSVNGRPVVRTPGHEVIEAILRAWAGEDPIASRLQRLALRQPC